MTDTHDLPSESAKLKAHDLATVSLLLLLALFSLVWRDTGRIQLFAGSIPRGLVVAPVLVLLAVLIMALVRTELRTTYPLIRFVRTFYPQALFGPLFFEVILLSSRVFGGKSHDALFAALDEAIFGFQPAIAFSRTFSGSPFINELLFGAYCSFFVLLAVTPWIPYLRGDRKEAEREMAIFSGYMLIVFVFYVFFRVMGPKYWIPELKTSWYTEFSGGIFVAFMRWGLGFSTLSGAAFPSSHVAVSLMMCYFVHRTERRLLPLYAFLSLLICLATVYLYAHWATDVVGGALAAALLLPLLDRLRAPLSRLAAQLDSPERGGKGAAFEAETP